MPRYWPTAGPRAAPQGAREALEHIGGRLAAPPRFSPLQRSPLDRLMGRWTLDTSPVYVAMDLMSRLLSPYDLNPLGFNPLRNILAESIDFERLARSPIKLFVTATNVRTGRGRIFRNAEITADVLLASACLPTMFRAVEIDGEPYWDGGYAGNPTITPLIRESDAHDTILVQINPSEPPETPRTAADILNRLNEISFNSPLMKELRMIALLRQVADPGNGEGARWAKMRMHRIMTDMLANFGASSKLNAEWEFVSMLRDEGRRAARSFSTTRRRSRQALDRRSRRPAGGVLRAWAFSASSSGLALLVWLAFRGWSVLLLAPAAALVAAAVRRRAAACQLDANLHGERGAVSGAVLSAVSARRGVRQAHGGLRLGDRGRRIHDQALGERRVMLAVVLAGALVTYGGVSLFVAFFVLAPMARSLFRAAAIPRRLMPAAIVLGTSTFTMSALPGTPSIQNAIPMPFFGTTPFAAPGLGIIASLIMLGFGMWWLHRAEAKARRAAKAMAMTSRMRPSAPLRRARARTRHHRARIRSGRDAATATAATPSRSWLPRCRCRRRGRQSPDVACGSAAARLLVPRRGALGGTSIAAVGGRLVGGGRACRRDRRRHRAELGAAAGIAPDAWMPAPMPRCCRRSASRAWSASARSSRRCRLSRWCAIGCSAIEGGPLVSLAVATNVLAALTGSASGGLTIALDALGETYIKIAARTGIEPALMHRVAVIGSGTLDILPHNGAVVSLLAICG